MSTPAIRRPGGLHCIVTERTHVTAVAQNTTNLGFLSVTEEASGFLGGYLVTNSWGRPLEFRISSAVQPNKVQQILYGDTLCAYLCGEVIGKALVEKTATPVACVFVDQPMSLDVRRHIATPVGLWQSVADAAPVRGLLVQDRLYCHAGFPDDVPILSALAEKLGQFDLAEPFARIREAMVEARKMGVTMRRAA
jgi:hypothetical protein